MAKETKRKAKGTVPGSKKQTQLKKAATNGSGVTLKPIPKGGPNLTLRARNHTQIDKFKKAAAKTSLSLNTWAIEVLDRASAVQ